ncbi:MAG TPA: phosphoribosyltransferase, partial [Thermoleophilaceae bacterium]|nr:phosphoribosyltransferase [Thermoleophilaceae bacterium]
GDHAGMNVVRNPDGVLFRDRRHAGRALAKRLKEMAVESPVIVALPRGGVPVGYEVAQALDAPLDIGLVRKLGAPGHPEFGIGALGEGGTVVLDRGAVRALGVTREQLEAAIARERMELDRRRERYRQGYPPVEVAGRNVILVDDGLATGVTAAAAARVLKARGAAHVIVAVPVSPRGVGEELGSHFDDFVSLASPERFTSVGSWYQDFSQTPDEEVVELLRATPRGLPQAVPGGAEVTDPDVAIATRDGVRLAGTLQLPRDPRGLVIFVHGSGSSRHSRRNLAVARHLNQLGLATLLFDLLTDAEAADRHNVFDIDLLTKRLLDATGAAAGRPELQGLPLGYFGASTGAAAALRAAAELGDAVGAVVSRGGRPDLAGEVLSDVRAPTLLIVGGNDWNVLELNDEATTLLGGPTELALVVGATHLFEEPGALEQVARLAGRWFVRHLSGRGARPETAARGTGT